MPQLVLSASRRTDIPAFYMPWFMSGIRKGYFEVVNPYNRQTTRVSVPPDKVHTIVFWSKNFGPFLSRDDVALLTEQGYHLFFNFTINSAHPILEPNLPPLQDRLAQLAQLAQRFGPEKIQWRFDPICFCLDSRGRESDNLDGFDAIAQHAAKVGIRTCITSFVDLYRKVLRRTEAFTDLTFIDPPIDRKVETIITLADKLAPMGISLQLCCEKEVLAALPKEVPVSASACIPNDRLTELHGPGISLAKDHGQRIRSGCQCRISRDIGSYTLHPCHHNCLFCYANPAADKA